MSPREAIRAPLPQLGRAGVRTVHANAVARIRQAILDGDLPAGTHLVQTELAAALQVSVTPVREALRELATEGLVDFDAFRGAVVHTPTLAEMDEIYSIRCALTPLSVARSISAVGDEELELARSLAVAMADCGDAIEWVELNRRFHHVLDAASHSPHLSGVLGRLADISVVYVNLSLGPGGGQRRRDDADDEHRRLVDAFSARDVALASTIAVSHLSRTLDSVRRAFVERDAAPSAIAAVATPRTDRPSGRSAMTARFAVEEQWT
jgi:DNA-binding GntR family transcriptional regulator